MYPPAAIDEGCQLRLVGGAEAVHKFRQRPAVITHGKSFASDRFGAPAPAIRFYDVATEAKPDSEWAWRQLAVADALAGKKKDGLKALRKAHDLTTDKSAFAKWLQSEPAFEALRPSAEFRALL